MNKVLKNLKEEEYLYIYDDKLPIIIFKQEGKLKEYMFKLCSDRELGNTDRINKLLKTSNYKICKNVREFLETLKHDYLEPSLYDEIISESSINYKSIKEDIDRYSGKYHKDGFYLVGATSSTDDYYYLYWNPETKKFNYSSCCGSHGINENETRELPEKYLKELRELVNKEVFDAVFPSSYLNIYI